MKLKSLAAVLLPALVPAMLALSPAARAQDRYPSKPVQVLVPVSPGTTADIVARIYTDRLSQKLGQQFVVVNRQGAGGTIAAGVVAKSPADGYTLILANTQHTVNPALYDNLPYDTLKDFAGVALVAESPSFVVVSPQLGTRTLKEFIAHAKDKPRTINYGSAGVGSATHMAGAYFASRAGIDLVHVPYKSSSELTADLLSGRIQATFVPPAFLMAQIREGKLLALGVSSREPMRAPLEVPSISESAIPGFEYATWYGFLAPARTPAPALETLARAIREIADEPAVRERYRTQALATRILTLKDFDAYLKADMERLVPLARASGARAN